MIIGLGVLVIYLLSIVMDDSGIAVGQNPVPANERPSEWQEMIASDINGEHIVLNVDGVDVTFKDGHLYMGNDMNIMIPLDVFPDVFKCAVNSIDTERVELQRGNTVVRLIADKGGMYVNDRLVDIESPVKIVEGVCYINSKVLSSGFGYSYNWISKDNTLHLSKEDGGKDYLPSRYNYAEVGRMPDVKNQGSLSTCWAFSAMTALESSLMPYEKYEFSVDNMVGNNGYSASPNEGGDYTRAIAYLTAWRGPVYESDDPYGDGHINKDAKPQKHLQEAQIIESKNLEAIKKAVFLQGGVESSMYTSMSGAGQSSWYYNKEKSAYCYIGTQKPNHDVVIVGWDDTFSKDNFSVPLEGDGAFICANSWGKEFGDNGLFYVSYYDSNIGIHNLVYTRIDSADNYDNIYQSDICGWVGQLGYEEESAYFANVYTAEADEVLRAVGFYATGKNTTYEVYISENFENQKSLNDRKLLATGSLKNAGFYTIDIDGDISLAAGKKYAVIVKINTPGAVHPIAIEYRAGRATKDVILDDGEGYISYLGRVWEAVEESKKCNICLKMYTDSKGK